ncbi:hypothetical protein BDF19DRAFT_65541 [Syncephalis fuscata]|nr:hypothetical protein BDF19DRAFT_65541 [Syncephalis fuscata]
MIRPGNGPTSIEATIIDYDNCQLLAGRDGTMLEVKDFTNVKYLNMPSVRHCRAENFNIGRMIFETITDDLLNDGDFTKQRTRWLSYIEKAKGINKTKVPVQRLSEKTSIDSNETFLNDLDKIDAKTAHYLLPLLEIMDWLLTNTSADCQLPDKMVKALKLSKTSMILDRLANQCLSHMLCQNGIRD